MMEDIDSDEEQEERDATDEELFNCFNNQVLKDVIDNMETDMPGVQSDSEEAAPPTFKPNSNEWYDVEEHDEEHDNDEQNWDNGEPLTKSECTHLLTLDIFSHSEDMKHCCQKHLKEEAVIECCSMH